MSHIEPKSESNYWGRSIMYTLSILGVWFLCSYGCGILFRDWCDDNLPKIGNAKFGFWMAQQGSIIVFVVLLIVYAFLMARLDKTLKD